ncbi:MAG: aldo/keto reductase [Patescibacteria group bacterium]
MTQINQPFLTLKSGNNIPQLGFGTWRLQGQECIQAVSTALQIGYRHIDTAHAYGNHQEVGQAIQSSQIPRSEIFLTTKLWRNDMNPAQVIPALERALQELQTDYIDLYLIHWPNKQIPAKNILQEMHKAKNQGLIKSVGVSNFTISHLEQIKQSNLELDVNQVEFHPSLNQMSLLQYCQDNQIVLTAYSPIAQGYDLQLPLVQELSQKYNVSESQIILNWLLQKKIVAIPKAGSTAHIQDNFNTIQWEMLPEDIEKMDKLNQNYRVVNPSFAEFEEENS